ncbi:MAG: GNAT family N-acetyltransferase [Clostridia bacterium]|jgi:ribosomal-protein-alanine N-acetyltransferase|nr:GNAT family N-acetyltransferase [Clostridia bacterium]
MKKELICRLFSHMPELSTERLLLRRMRVTDAEDMHRYACRSEVTRYLLWSPHPDLSYTREYLQYLNTRYAAGTFYDWAVTLRSNGRMIGTCGFTTIDPPNECAEVGYVLAPEYWGQGIAAEAVRAVLAFGFERLLLHRIEARFIEGNEASLRVMQKVGMTFEGYRRESMLIKGVRRNIGYSSILCDEFRATAVQHL